MEQRCINLMDRLGREYRIGWNPAYDPKGRPRDTLDPWYMVVVCRHGEICPYGGSQLAVEAEGRPKIKGRLAALPFCKLYQDGDDFGSFIFDVADFAQVAEIVKPSPATATIDGRAEAAGGGPGGRVSLSATHARASWGANDARRGEDVRDVSFQPHAGAFQPLSCTVRGTAIDATTSACPVRHPARGGSVSLQARRPTSARSQC